MCIYSMVYIQACYECDLLYAGVSTGSKSSFHQVSSIEKKLHDKQTAILHN